MPVVTGDLIEVTVNCNAIAQYSSNVFHFEIGTTAGAVPTDLDIADGLDATLAPLFKDILPTTCYYWGIKVQILKPVRRPGQYSIISRGVGTVAGDIGPSQVTGLITAQTNLTGARYRGRQYLPFPGEGSNDAGGDPLPAYVTSARAIATAIYTPSTVSAGVGNTAVLNPVVYSRKFNSWQAITARKTSEFWATQKRRAARARGDHPPS